jgi:aspartate/methionine/tyrosine aminotransferase
MNVEPFEMERLQSTYENEVAFNLSESGVHPLTLGELVDDAASRDALMQEGLRYTQTNGTAALRALVAQQYPGATADHVEITNGGSEANYIATWSLVEPGDEVVFMVPNYRQMFGLGRGFGGIVKEWPLVVSGQRWAIDVDALSRAVTPRTKLIVICNPNNPTGARFDAADLDRIAAIADRHGSWILADETYRGAERDGRETPTMWGRSARVIVTSGLSKAYGLPGLRVGWIVAPPERIASCWMHHDYTTIAPGALSDALAQRALEPSRRSRILARTRRILNDNFPVVAKWLDGHADLFDYVPPDAGAIVYVRARQEIDSIEFVDRLRRQKSVLLVPGAHFGMEGWVRIGFGSEAAALTEGLRRLHEFVEESRTIRT